MYVYLYVHTYIKSNESEMSMACILSALSLKRECQLKR